MNNNPHGFCWYKDNKAASDWTPEQAENIFLETYKFIESNEKIRLKSEVFLYLAKEHGVAQSTYYFWINNLYKDNKSIVILNQSINQLLESRMIYDKEIRPNIQALVLINRHGFSDKKDVNLGGQKDNPIQVIDFSKIEIDNSTD